MRLNEFSDMNNTSSDKMQDNDCGPLKATLKLIVKLLPAINFLLMLVLLWFYMKFKRFLLQVQEFNRMNELAEMALKQNLKQQSFHEVYRRCQEKTKLDNEVPKISKFFRFYKSKAIKQQKQI